MNLDIFFWSNYLGTVLLGVAGIVLISFLLLYWSFCAKKASQKNWDYNVKHYDETTPEELKALSVIIKVIAFFFLFGGISGIIFGNINRALLKANRQRIIYYYTSQEVVKKDIEPLVRDFAGGLSKFVAQPNLTVNINKGKE